MSGPSQTLNAERRTLNAEVMRHGTYGSARFSERRAVPLLRVQASALAFEAWGSLEVDAREPLLQRKFRSVEALADFGRAGINPMKQRRYDLEERLMEFAVRVIRVSESMKKSRAGTYIGDQLLRSGTSPYGHHGEAEAAESRADFVHKLKVCHKELREARRWLRLVQRTPLIERPELLDTLMSEADELVRIFTTSIKTAERNGTRRSAP